MKKILLTIFLVCTLSFTIVNAQCPIVPYAVVELFTSQGCSYCPPAGEALDSASYYEKISGRNVICIAEHVQYGSSWSDPFMDPQFSNRQYYYCLYTGVPVQGTPESWVNGKLFINANLTPAIVTQHINIQLGSANTPTAGVCLTLQSAPTAPTLSIGYTLSGNTSGANLIVCLTEDSLVTNVTSGENQGTTLHESCVSRKFIVTPITTTTGTINLTPPANCVRANCNIVAYVQNATTMAIRGATKGIDLGNVTTDVPNISLANGFNVYPNPAVNDILVSYINKNMTQDVAFSMMDVSGRIVATEKISNNGNGEYIKNLDLTAFSKGIYIVTLMAENETINKKIIIE